MVEVLLEIDILVLDEQAFGSVAECDQFVSLGGVFALDQGRFELVLHIQRGVWVLVRDLLLFFGSQPRAEYGLCTRHVPTLVASLIDSPAVLVHYEIVFVGFLVFVFSVAFPRCLFVVVLLTSSE